MAEKSKDFALLNKAKSCLDAGQAADARAAKQAKLFAKTQRAMEKQLGKMEPEQSTGSDATSQIEEKRRALAKAHFDAVISQNRLDQARSDAAALDADKNATASKKNAVKERLEKSQAAADRARSIEAKARSEWESTPPLAFATATYVGNGGPGVINRTPDAPGSGDAAPGAVGKMLQQSAYATTSGCSQTKKGVATTGQAILSVHRQLLRPQDASDNFGRRLGKRFLVYQVTVTNSSKDFQYEVSDISVDLGEVFKIVGVPNIKDKDSEYARQLGSSQNLDLLRGIPEKGQDYDPRNMTLHIMQGIGAVGAGVSGLTPFTDVMGSAMANFNGAFLQGVTGVFPDHTGSQLNRLSDHAFASNTLIERLQTKVFVIFVPESFVVPKAQQGALWSDPRTLLNWLPLDQVNVCVDGVLLVQVDATPDPVFSTDTVSAVGTLNPVNVTDKTKVALSDAGASPTIYYTTNGDVPSDKSDKFDPKNPIVVEKKKDITVKAFAITAGKAPSNIVTTTFHAADAAPKPTSVGLDNTTKTTVVIAPGNANDTVYYTTDGSSPSPASASTSVYKVGTPIVLPTDGTSITVTAVEVGNTTAFSPATTGGPFTAPK